MKNFVSRIFSCIPSKVNFYLPKNPTLPSLPNHIWQKVLSVDMSRQHAFVSKAWNLEFRIHQKKINLASHHRLPRVFANRFPNVRKISCSDPDVDQLKSIQELPLDRNVLIKITKNWSIRHDVFKQCPIYLVCDNTQNYTSNSLQSLNIFLKVKSYPEYISRVSVDQDNYREIALAAVKIKGNLLEHIHPNLNRDKEIVITAVKQAGLTLRYAHVELKLDREVVLTAVQQNPFALQYAHVELQGDREIVFAAVKRFPHVMEYASIELKNDWKFAFLITWYCKGGCFLFLWFPKRHFISLLPLAISLELWYTFRWFLLWALVFGPKKICSLAIEKYNSKFQAIF